ncbi:MAG: ABC transporter ATP-binding protein [Caldilineaceae bacterium]|nr:ABC transporter ATP-binding protein [Caldilineaceae bacterium]
MGGPGGRPGMNLPALKRALGYSLHYSHFMMLALGSMLIGTLAQLAVPQFIQDILDNVTLALAASGMAGLDAVGLDSLMADSGFTLEQLTTAANNPLQPLVVSSVLILFFSIARGVFAFLQAYMAEKNGQYAAYDFRNELFAKISSLSFSYHDRQRTGELMVRATDDVEKVRQFISQGLLMAGQALVLMVASLSILFYTNWRLALVVVPILPVAMLMFMFFGNRVGPLFAMIQQRLSHLNSILQENVAGLQVVKSYVREKSEQARFGKVAEEHMRNSIRVSRFMSVMFPFVFLVANLAIVAVTWYGGRLLIFNELTLGQWSKFMLYITYIFFPIGQFGFIIAMATQASASAARVFEILDTDVEVRNRPGARTLDTVQGMVEFRNVTFRYFEGSEPVLNDVSFGVMPGETIAILGATGSGKSTIINLLPRFYDVSDGAILIDGLDIRDATLDSLRSQIGIVLQETVLFSGTIRDNIAFGRPEATDAEVEAVARDAAIHDFIASQPNGYKTDVGERGSTLSGGQKQRVAIARALLLQPRILILDDSTSSVDLQTEQRIQQALDRLMEQRTSFVIAQRISTVRNADRILVLEHGRLVATGTHETLMESNELYVDIFSSQLVDDSAALAEAQAGWA